MRILVAARPETIIKEVGVEMYNKHLGGFNAPTGYYDHSYCETNGIAWGIDNGAFTGFKPERFLKLIVRYSLQAKHCKFVVLPDRVSDSRATATLFDLWYPTIKATGLPIALAAQDGLTIENIDFDRIDALFIGGSTEWKLGSEALHLITKAKTLGKWVHMGRVNGNKRLRYAKAIGCDSVDGSSYARFKSKLHKALEELEK